MSVSMVSSSAVGQTYQRPPGGAQGPGKEIRQGIDTLKKAVESGDMTAVQSAYDSLSKLQTDKQGGSSATGSSSSSTDPLSKLLSGVGEALKSGDISQVQQAVAQNGPPQGGPGGPGGAGSPPPGGRPPGGASAGGGDAGGSDEVRSAVGSLADSLRSGDLSGAKDSLSALSDLLKSNSDEDDDDGEDEDSEDEDGSATASATGTDANDFLQSLKSSLSDLGSALGSGDLASAQKLFASLTPRGSQGVDITA